MTMDVMEQETVITAREKVCAAIAELDAILKRKGGLWEDQQARLDALRDALRWIDEEQQQRDEIEAAAAAAEAEQRPENKYADTRALFKNHKAYRGR